MKLNEHEFHVLLLSRGTGVHNKHIFREINYEIGVGKKDMALTKILLVFSGQQTLKLK